MPPGLTQPAGACDVLVTGRYFCDLVFTGLPDFPRPGTELWSQHCEITPGASFIPAVALRRLGLDAVWPCSFGNDLFSRYVLEQAEQEGLNGDWLLNRDEGQLALSVSISLGGERAFLSYADAEVEPPYASLIDELHPRWVLLVHLWDAEKLERISAAARRGQTRILMDCQAHQASLADPQVRRALALVDVFSPNAAEALSLTGAPSLETALAELAALTPLVIIKLGGDGAIARHGDRVIRVPGIQVDAIDTTGAGDNFDSGFLYAQLQGYSLEDSLRCANICGGLSTRQPGGTAAAPTRAVVEEWLARYRSSVEPILDGG